VVGSAGGPAKTQFVRDELGFDACFDYRAIEPREALREVAPDGVDVYFDNVGGVQLEAAIGALNRGGRIALCGSVSGYNAVEPPPGPRNLSLLVGKRGMMRGFIVGDHARRETEFRGEVGDLIVAGGLRLAETVVEGGLEAAPGAFIDMLRGKHLGKVVVAL
jgi:NADPH-dependent curcumin reductase CurA